MDKLKIMLGIIATAVILLGANQIGTYQEQLDIKRIKLETIQEKHQSTLKELEDISSELDRAREDVDTSKEAIEQLEAEKQRLESELQAKKQRLNKRVVYAAEQTITGQKADWLAASNIPSDQYHIVDWLVSRESSWNPTAQNPTSSAYGLKQFLDSTWSSVGCTKSSEPVYQLNCGHKYVMQRYGSWSNAKAFWQANNWY